MKRYRIDMDRETVMAILMKEVPDSKIAAGFVRVLEKLSAICTEESRKKQIKGIKKAKESGVALGRPKIETPDNFEELMKEWERGNIRAEMAARICGMGISTFYRKVRCHRDKK